MNKNLYHCGHCGSFFESELGHSDTRICGVCQRKPGTGLRADTNKQVLKRAALPAFENKGESVDESGERAIRKKRRKNTMLRIVVVWTLVMVTAICFHRRNSKQEREIADKKSDKPNLAKGTLADERIALLSRALPQCHQALAGFLTAGTPEERNQYVADPIATAGRMALYYTSNPFPRVDAKRIRRIAQEPVRIGDEWMIETRWKEGESGAEFDAVFRRESGVWMLDWDHFARFSGYPWVLFLSGEGPQEAEFRLLARKVAGGNQAEQGGTRFRFVLLSPEFGKPLETGIASPELVVDRRSDEGLMLEAAFQAKTEGHVLFGGTLKAMEPEDLVRVRILLKRGEFGGVRSFDVKKVIACHWINSDVPGFDPAELIKE